MRTVLLIDQNKNSPLFATFCNETDYRLRKIDDCFSLALHLKEFQPEVVVFNLPSLTDSLADEIIGLTANSNIAVMIYCETCPTGKIAQLIQANVSFLSIDASQKTSIDRHIDIAITRFMLVHDLKNALEEARTQLEDRKQIDRAKAILIKTRNFSEDEAYHTLRKLAMGRNITLGEMARNVIAMADLLK